MLLRMHQPIFVPGQAIIWASQLASSGLTRFQPVSYNRNFIVGQISVIAELYVKIGFPLNEPALSQPASYNQPLKQLVLIGIKLIKEYKSTANGLIKTI